MIAITFALPAESSGLQRLLRRQTSTKINGGLLVRGELHGKQILLFHTGVGAAICRQRLDTLFATENFSCLISAGFAGALTDELQVGDLFVAENFSAPKLVFLAREFLVPMQPRFGRLASASVMIDGADARKEFAAASGATAVDMETESIVAACATRHLPLLSLRAISDTPAAAFPAPADILFNLRRQKTEFSRLAFYLTKHPAAVVRLIQFSRRIANARAALTAAIDCLLRSDQL